MPVWLTWMYGFALMTAESAVLAAAGAESFCVQTGLIFAILLGLRRDFVPGAWTLAISIPVAEWFAGGPSGPYGLGLGVVFVGLQSLRYWLPDDWGLMHLGVAATAVPVHAAVFAAASSAVGLPGELASAVFWSLPVAWVGVLAGLVPAQWLLERGDAVFEGPRRRALFD